MLLMHTTQVRGIASCISSSGFLLTDGSKVQADALIYCTGYEFSFPFLSERCGVSIQAWYNELQMLHCFWDKRVQAFKLRFGRLLRHFIFSDPFYLKISSNATLREHFAQATKQFVMNNKFDGVTLNYEWPNCWEPDWGCYGINSIKWFAFHIV